MASEMISWPSQVSVPVPSCTENGTDLYDHSHTNRSFGSLQQTQVIETTPVAAERARRALDLERRRLRRGEHALLEAGDAQELHVAGLEEGDAQRQVDAHDPGQRQQGIFS